MVDEEALREVGAGLDSVFEQSHVPMNVLSLDGRFLAVNRAYAQLVEYPTATLVEDDPRIIHPDDQDERRRLEGELLRSAEHGGPLSYRVERRLVTRSGRVVWVDSSVTLIRDARGRPIAFFDTLVDITAGREASATLRRTAERLALLNEMDVALLEARSVEEAAAAIVGRVRPLLGAMLVGVVAIEDGRATVLAIDADDPGAVLPGALIPIVESVDDLERGEVREVDDLDAIDAPPPAYRAASAAGAGRLTIVPLISRGELIGALALGTDRGAPIGADALEIAREVARSLAVALQGAAQEAALAASHDRLQTVVEVERAVLEARSAEDLLSTTLRRLRRLVPTIGIVATSVDYARRLTTVLAVDADHELPVPAGTVVPLLGEFDDLLAGRVRIVPDLAQVPAPAPPAFAAALAIGARSLLTVPLIARGDWIGSLNLARAEPDGFSAEDVRLVEEIAASLAGALDTQRILSQLERAAGELAVRVEERTAQLRAVLDSTPDPIWAFDRDGLPVISNAPGAAFLREELGLRPDVSLATVLARLAAISTDPDRWRQRSNDLAAYPDLELREVVEIQGTRRVLALYTGVVRDGDAISGRLLLLRDVSAERQAERAKEDLLAAVSHEIRTPLTGIANAADILSRRALQPEQVELYVGLIARETERLKTVVSDFLDLQSVDRGRLLIEPRAFDLDELVREVATLHAEGRPGHVIAIAGEPLRVLADRDRIAQVVGNLVSNAVKYSPGGGAIAVTTERRGRSARVSVVDEGMGVADTEAALVFSRFFRGDAARARGIAGTGLGLALAREIVEASGGSIGLERPAQGGSVFWFELPLEDGRP